MSDCELNLEIKHKAGCPVDFYGGLFGSYAISFSSAVLICILGAVILYFFVEACNALCKEHSEEARNPKIIELVDLVKEGVTYSYAKIKNAISKPNNQYENL